MKPIPFKMKGTEYALTVKIATYPEGNLAIKLYQESFGQLVFWDSLTVNLGGLRAKDCGFINTKTTGKRYHAWIKRNGLGERTGQVRLEDGTEYVEYIFNTQKLKKLDLDGYTYYSRRLNGELGRRYMRLYIALRRLAKHIPGFHYTDYSGAPPMARNSSGATTPRSVPLIRFHYGLRRKIQLITGISPLSITESRCVPSSPTAIPRL